MEFFLIATLNGVSYGLLLFLLSAGLTLIFSMMGVLHFAHASFYMLGAYVGYSLSQSLGFWPALLLAPLLVGALGALFERAVLRRVHPLGHVPEMLVTFGLSYVLLEVVQLIWGRSAVAFTVPPALQGPAFTLIDHATLGLQAVWGAAPADACQASEVVRVVCTPFPASRAFMMVVSLAMLGLLWALLKRSRIGLVIQAAITHPRAVEALGHNVPRIFMLVFGIGSALAGLAGVIGGSTYLTDPAMAATMGPIVFVVLVVGGVGSLSGAFVASLLIGLLQTYAVSWNVPLPAFGLGSRMTLAQWAPVLPYVLMLAMLMLRPTGLLGRRGEGL